MKNKTIVNFGEYLGNFCYYNGGWVKKIDKIDTTKSNGFCFEGDLVRKEGLVEVEIGIYLICDIQGSRKNQKKFYYVVRVCADGSIETLEEEITGRDWALQLRDELLELPELKLQKMSFDPIDFWNQLELSMEQRDLVAQYVKSI